MSPLYYTLYPKKMEKRKVTRSTAAQIKLLIDYMSTHVDLANNDGEFASTSPILKQKKQEEWKRLANMLREHGPEKSVEQWKCTWKDLKKKARDEIKRVQTDNTEPIPEISRKYIKILNTIGFDNITDVEDDTEDGESTDSNSNDATNKVIDITSDHNVEFVDSQNKKAAKRKIQDPDEEHSDEKNSERDHSEHEFDHSFHLRPTRSTTPLIAHNASSIELNETTEDQGDSDEYGIFGLLVAKKIRKLNYRHRLVAQQRINQILFDLEMQELKT